MKMKLIIRLLMVFLVSGISSVQASMQSRTDAPTQKQREEVIARLKASGYSKPLRINMPNPTSQSASSSSVSSSSSSAAAASTKAAEDVGSNGKTDTQKKDDINKPDAFGHTELSHAVVTLDVKKVKDLLSKGADIKVLCQTRSVYSLVCQLDQEIEEVKSIKKLLEDKGAKEFEEKLKQDKTAKALSAKLNSLSSEFNAIKANLKSMSDLSKVNNTQAVRGFSRVKAAHLMPAVETQTSNNGSSSSSASAKGRASTSSNSSSSSSAAKAATESSKENEEDVIAAKASKLFLAVMKCQDDTVKSLLTETPGLVRVLITDELTLYDAFVSFRGAIKNNENKIKYENIERLLVQNGASEFQKEVQDAKASGKRLRCARIAALGTFATPAASTSNASNSSSSAQAATETTSLEKSKADGDKQTLIKIPNLALIAGRDDFDAAAELWVMLQHASGYNPCVINFAADNMEHILQQIMKTIKNDGKNITEALNVVDQRILRTCYSESLIWLKKLTFHEDLNAYCDKLFAKVSEEYTPLQELQEQAKKIMRRLCPKLSNNEKLGIEIDLQIKSWQVTMLSPEAIEEQERIANTLNEDPRVLDARLANRIYNPGELKELIEKLKGSNALDSYDQYGSPLLHYAAYYSKASSLLQKKKGTPFTSERIESPVDLLIRAGANVNVRDAQGRIALILAVDQEVKSLLKAYGADINTRDANGETALHTACKASAVDVVQALLDEGIDFKLLDNQGRTAYHLAISQEVLEVLNKFGAGKYEKEREDAKKAADDKQDADEKQNAKAQAAKKERDKAKQEARQKRSEDRQKNKLKQIQDAKLKAQQDAQEAVLKAQLDQERAKLKAQQDIFAEKIRNKKLKSAIALWQGNIKEKAAIKINTKEVNALRDKNNLKLHLVKWRSALKSHVAQKKIAQQQRKLAHDLKIKTDALKNSLKLFIDALESTDEIIADRHLNLLAATMRLMGHYIENNMNLEAMEKEQKDLIAQVFAPLKGKLFDFNHGESVDDFTQNLFKWTLDRQTKLSAADNMFERACDAIRANNMTAFEQTIKDGVDINKQSLRKYIDLFGRTNFNQVIKETIEQRRREKLAALRAQSSASAASSSSAPTAKK